MRGTVEERFWAKVNKAGHCWEWNACLSDTGYGTFYIAPVNRLAHKVAWELKHGPVPKGMCVLHVCDNRKCVLEAHLFLGTKADNTHDALAKGRPFGRPRKIAAHADAFYLWGNAIPPILPKGLVKMGNQGGWRRGDGTFRERDKTKRIPAAKAATIPPELANCVADYAERLLEQKRLTGTNG